MISFKPSSVLIALRNLDFQFQPPDLSQALSFWGLPLLFLSDLKFNFFVSYLRLSLTNSLAHPFAPESLMKSYLGCYRRSTPDDPRTALTSIYNTSTLRLALQLDRR